MFRLSSKWTKARQLTLIGKYAGAVKATNAAPALLPLPSRERVGVRVHRGAAFPPHPALSPSRGEGNGAEHTSRYFGTGLVRLSSQERGDIEVLFFRRAV